MAYCLMAPSHYLCQCWFIIKVFYGIHLRAITLEMLPALVSVCLCLQAGREWVAGEGGHAGGVCHQSERSLQGGLLTLTQGTPEGTQRHWESMRRVSSHWPWANSNGRGSKSSLAFHNRNSVTVVCILTAIKQLALRTLLSVCLSVCYSFFTMFLSSYHHEIFRSYYKWQKWCPCKRSRSEVKGQGPWGQNSI